MYKFKYSAKQLAVLINGTVEGDEDVIVTTITKINALCQANSLTFLSNIAYEPYLYSTKAAIIIVAKTLLLDKQRISSTLIRVEDPYLALAKLLNALKPADLNNTISSKAILAKSSKTGKDVYIGENAFVGENVKIGHFSKIYPNVYIGNHVIIGSNCVIYPGVILYPNSVVGNNVIIHAGAVIGADGFGFAPSKGKFVKIQHIGNVVIEDDVEIGANTTIDRAQFDSTIIKAGVKIDNLVMIGHNVVVGENSVIAAQVGIAGSTKIGRNCIIAGQAGLSGHIKIADKSIIGPQSGVSKSISLPGRYMGSPSMPFLKFARLNALFKTLLNKHNA